ncbi:MAG: ribonuclease P protein component [Bacillota bacterium]
MESLKKNKDFRKVYSKGKSKASRYLVIYKLKNNLNYNRYGFSISKKIANAVGRNRLKRRLREIIREIEKKDKIVFGYDIIFIARKPVVDLDFHKLKTDCIRLIKKMGLDRKNQ